MTTDFIEISMQKLRFFRFELGACQTFSYREHIMVYVESCQRYLLTQTK